MMLCNPELTDLPVMNFVKNSFLFRNNKNLRGIS